jgi:H+/Cl- antiporter ClcA
VIARVGTFCRFSYEFIVGDDWRIATGVVAALGVTALLANTTTLPVWWIVIVVVVTLLPLSVRRAARATTPAVRSRWPDPG